MKTFFFRTWAAAAAIACGASAGDANAQGALRPNCYSPLSSINMGGATAVVWHLRAGFTCSVSIRIATRYQVERAEISQKGRLGTAGASANRTTEPDGRTLVRVAYRSPRNTPAGVDTFTVRLITLEKASGQRANTFLTYRVELWRE